MERVLVTGGSGLLGSKVVELAKRNYEVVSTHHAKPILPDSLKLDVADKDQVIRVIEGAKPDIVIHVAAQTDVDRCETNRAEAWAVNAGGTRNVSEVCDRIGAKLVYVSTDYVFDGERGMYSEDDRPNPLNYYGKTKLQGEKFVMSHCEDFVVARASVIYGWHPWRVNFVTWIVRSLMEGKRVTVARDHFNSPTFADNLAEVLLRMAERDVSGVFHTAGAERISRFDFAVRVADVFDLDETLISPIKMDELEVWVARRPRDSSLRVDKARETVGVRLLDTVKGLTRMRGLGNCKKEILPFKK